MAQQQKKKPKKMVLVKQPAKKAVNHMPNKVVVSRWQRIQLAIGSPIFGRAYATFAAIVLLVSTCFWAIMGARLQSGNADQLVNAYLFEHASTFHGALMPGAHSFFIKWPLFLLIRMFGFSTGAFTAVTVGVVLVTVGALAAIIYRIERRPLVFGTLFLALASVLLLVPAVPSPGTLLPLNMAMLTTRNIEYILYIASLVLFMRSPRVKSWRFWTAALLLGLLVASDKLFLTLGVGSALVALFVYGLARKWVLVKLAAGWLAVSLVAGAFASGLLAALNDTGATNIVGQSTASPYGVVHGAHGIFLGGFYALTGLISNFGANPAIDLSVLSKVPHQIYAQLLAPGGISFLINFTILVASLVMVIRFGVASFARAPKPTTKKAAATQLPGVANSVSLFLVASTVVALVVFVLTNHYYPVDGRYLTISLFAAFITAAALLRTKKLVPEKVVFVGMVILVGIVAGLPAVWQTHAADGQALADINQRNAFIAQAIKHHPVSTLVGDYWRILPIKQLTDSKQAVLPLAGCSQPRNTLTSTVWEPDLHHHSFAYVLPFDRSLTDYPQCNLAQIQQAYGRPDASVVIAGTPTKPRGVLLFYDQGIHHIKQKPNQPVQSAGIVAPINLTSLPRPNCSAGTVMQVVAHQDDDLLFMNPDLLHDIQAGKCVRTVYVTAGDGGADKFYWLSREQGSEAAYDSMDGPGKDVWTQRTAKLLNQEFVSIVNPRGNSKISLIFMHLPDGNINGSGFKASNYESLARLEAGKVARMQTVDGQSSYSSEQLKAALTELFMHYQPTEIRTQANYVATKYPDHSDHMAVGRFVKHAYAAYQAQQPAGIEPIPLNFYVGYPVHERLANVTDGDLVQKEAAFFAYAKFDSGVCASVEQCLATPTYNAYLHRQYQNEY